MWEVHGKEGYYAEDVDFKDSPKSSVPDPHQVDPAFNFDADLDPASNFDADPDRDPTFHSDADPDPDPSFQIKAQNLEKVLK